MTFHPNIECWPKETSEFSTLDPRVTRPEKKVQKRSLGQNLSKDTPLYLFYPYRVHFSTLMVHLVKVYILVPFETVPFLFLRVYEQLLSTLLKSEISKQ